DGGHAGAVLHHRKGEAGIDPPPVRQHGAGAALPVIASLLGAGQIEMIAQCVEERGPWRNAEPPVGAVDVQRYRNLLWHRQTGAARTDSAPPLRHALSLHWRLQYRSRANATMVVVFHPVARLWRRRLICRTLKAGVVPTPALHERRPAPPE